MPVTGLLFLAGTTAICALPPLNGFVSELLIYLGMLDGIASGSDVLASAAGLAALALIGGVVILAFTKALRHGVPRRAPHARSGRSLRGR